MARPSKEGGISKMEAVRQAIATLGKDAKPADILPFIKTNYGVEMSPEMAYNYKSTALKQLGLKRRGRKPGRKPADVAAVAVPEPANGRRKAAVSVRISIEDIQAVKALADRIGAEKVQKLAAVLAK
jgi:hypothetical protein